MQIHLVNIMSVLYANIIFYLIDTVFGIVFVMSDIVYLTILCDPCLLEGVVEHV